MPDDDVLKIRIENHICLLTLNRPEARNALSAELSLALVEAILDADENPDVFLIAITGEGDKAFCSGADLREANEHAKSGKIVRGPLHSPRRVMTEVLIDAKKPSLAIINGPGALSALLRGLTADNADYWGAFVAFGRSFSWAVVPFIGGLLLMGFAQIVMAFRRRS